MNLIPVSYRLSWSHYANADAWNFIEIKATRFDGLNPSRWAIFEGGCVLNKDGKWEVSVLPGSRDEDFLERTRWDSPEAAAEHAEKFKPAATVEGLES